MSTFSIVTPAYNSSTTISRTIESIKCQNLLGLEHVIIDGKSTDNTCKLINDFKYDHIYLTSELDNGIYDAMNKGLKKATSKFLGIINSDDYLIDNNVLADVLACFNEGADVVYGGIAYFNKTGDVISEWIPSEFKIGDYAKGWHAPHPAFFARAELYNRKGGFDLTYKVAADFDLMMRFMEDPEVNCVRIPRVLVMMQDDGASSRPRNILKGMIEIFSSFKKNGTKLNSIQYLLIRYLPKFKRKFL
jgi:glycosyltransferase